MKEASGKWLKKPNASVIQAPVSQPLSPVARESCGPAGQPSAQAIHASGDSCLGHDFSRVPALCGQASPTLGSRLPQLNRWAPPGVAATPLLYPSPEADNARVRALTLNNRIHLGTEIAPHATAESNAVLAHEAIHRIQQLRGYRQGCTEDLELEAHTLAADVLNNQPVKPQFHANANTPVMDTPHDRMVVERARRQLALLRRFVDEWTAREARRLRTATERNPLLEERQRMDRTSADLGPPGQRARMEEQNLANLNRRPLSIEVTEDEIRFQVSFHVRFEDPAMANRFADLSASLRRGIELVWNQRLRGTVFGGRRFSIIPRIVQVAANAARDPNYWLITVRPANNSPVRHPGCALDQPPAGVTAAVTDPSCAGGVMNLPPAAIADPSVIGHELLHLFGLVDRYLMLTQRLPGGRTRTESTPTRRTGGRQDPLGGESGTILREDLTFLLDRLGVYAMEENRGLEVLRRLERQGMSLQSVSAEIYRLEEIIRLGRDPNSLIPVRRDFRDRIVRDVENL